MEKWFERKFGDVKTRRIGMMMMVIGSRSVAKFVKDKVRIEKVLISRLVACEVNMTARY